MNAKFEAYASFGVPFRVVDDEYIWNFAHEAPDQELVDAKVEEMVIAEPMRLLRQERNRKIAETDWMANSDVVMNDDWKTYRQALRDLPSTASPSLDENGQLTNVTWPTKPT